MRKFFGRLMPLLFVILLFVSALLTACSCRPDADPDTPDPAGDTPAFQNPRASDATLLNGMDNKQDLLALKPMDVAPDDAYILSCNEDPTFTYAGEGSFRYEFVSGSSHTFLQLLGQSYHAALAVRELKAVSVEIYNAGDTAQQVTVSVTTATGAALISRSVTVQPGVWTQVSCDGLEQYSYKKKAAIGGVAFRFDAEAETTLYVDEMRVELGAADLPPADFNAVVASIADLAPVAKLDKATFAGHVAFASAVDYARRLYGEMSDPSQASSASLAALDRYTELLNGYAAVFTPNDEENVIERWSYGAALTVSTGEDDAYGTVYEIAVNAANSGEQSFRFADLDVGTFGEIVFWVYNPTDFELQLDIHGGWNTWLAHTYKLPAGAWTAVTVNAKTVENDIAGEFYAVISRQGKASFAGTFRFTALYGVPGTIAAQNVIDAIAALPATADITTADKNRVIAVREAYEELSRETKGAVTNYSRLTAAENRIAELEAAAFDAEAEALLSTTVTEENALDLYMRLIDLGNAYDALSELAAPRVTTLAALAALRSDMNERYLVGIVRQMIDALPEAADADFPGVIPQVDRARSLYDGLTAEQQGQVGSTDKMTLLLTLCENYRLLFDFTVAGLSKVSNTTDFGNAWSGTMTVAADSVYGNYLLLNILSGHSNSTREAEFRLRELTQSIKGYEKVVFYVFCPIDGAIFRAWASDWTRSTDFPLAAGAWNRIELDTASFSDDCLDGMFFTVVAPAGQQPIGEWKISSPYAYFDEAETDRLVDAFVRAVDALPDTADLTLADEAAVHAARSAYNALRPHCFRYISQRYSKKLTAAEGRIAALKAETLLTAFAEAVDALPAPEDLTASDAGKVAAARAAYDALPADCLGSVDKAHVAKLTQCEKRMAELNRSGEVKAFAETVGSLTDASAGEDLYRAFLAYIVLTEEQQSDVTAEKAKLDALMTARAAETAAACAADIAAFDGSHSFPRDNAACMQLYRAVLALPDAVFTALSAETKTTVSDLYKEAQKYTVVTDVLLDTAFGDAEEDDAYGTVYGLTVRPEGSGADNLLFVLNSGRVGERGIVFYLYCPDGASDARMYFTGEWKGWGADATTSVTVTGDGWLRVAFSAEAVSNGANTSYWYLYLTSASAPEGGWRISEIYAF